MTSMRVGRGRGHEATDLSIMVSGAGQNLPMCGFLAAGI
jgi:hypothetical protein